MKANNKTWLLVSLLFSIWGTVFGQSVSTFMPYAFYFSPQSTTPNRSVTALFEQTIRIALQNRVNTAFIPSEYVLQISKQEADSLTNLIATKKDIQLNPSYSFSAPETEDVSLWIRSETNRIVKAVTILHANKVFFDVNQSLPTLSQDVYDRLFKHLCSLLPQVEFINFPSPLTTSYAATSTTPGRKYFGNWYRLAAPNESLRLFYDTRSCGGVYVFHIPTDANLIPPAPIMAQIRSFIGQLGKDASTWGASPITQTYAWGHILTQNTNLKLVLDGTYPANGRISFPFPGYRLIGGDGRMATYIQAKDSVIISVPHSAYADSLPQVLTLNFDKPIRPIPHRIAKGLVLSEKTANPLYALLRLPGDTLRSFIIGYEWEVGINYFNRLSLIYTQHEVKQSVHLQVDTNHCEVELTDKFPNATRTNDGDEPFKTFRKAVTLNDLSGANRHTIRIVSRNLNFHSSSRIDNAPALSRIRIWINPIN